MRLQVSARYLLGLSLLFGPTTAEQLLGQTQGDYLGFADKVRLLNCAPAATSPCFRLKLNALTAQGAPASLDLPAASELARSVTVTVDGQELRPFYAAAESVGSPGVQGRVAFVLVDISGSMNRKLSSGESRFEAAKIALSRFLDNFQDGFDKVAIVPFESHNVAAPIQNAHFANTKEAALEQVAALPLPRPKNNTALYSSVSMALGVLKEKAHEQAGKATPPDLSLIVMTDGKNEVFKGDDTGLLDGPAGLEQTASKVRESGIQVVGVGFGNAAEIDETALRAISTKSYFAQDAGTLGEIFAFARRLLNNRIVVTFASPWPDRASLSGRNVRVSAHLRLASGRTLSSPEQNWAAPEMGIPVFDQKCNPAEMKALLFVNKVPPANDWVSIVRPLLVFVSIGALILILWFWLPRLIWPERYLGIAPISQRWMNTQLTKLGRRAPTGFGSGKSGALPPRMPADATIVQPRTEFTKTRLDRNV